MFKGKSLCAPAGAALALVCGTGCAGSAADVEETHLSTQQAAVAIGSVPAYELRVKFYALSNVGGTLGPTVTRQQASDAIAMANQVFANSSIRFVYDPDADWIPHQNNSLNAMVNDG